MKLFRTLILPLLVVAALPLVASAQAKIAPGMYQMIPDANFSGGIDVAGIDIEFTESTMTATQGGAVLVKSTFTLVGDMVTLVDTEGQVACPSSSKYKITMTEKGFRMTPVEDACPERAGVLAQVSLVKK